MGSDKSNHVEERVTKITEATLLSIHVVVVLIGITVWLTKLSFHIEQVEKEVKYAQEDIQRLENHCDKERTVSCRANQVR